MNSVNRSALPVPQVLQDLDFEELFERDLAAFRSHMGEDWNAQLESDPVTKLLEVGAWRSLLDRARVNDAAKSLLLAYARGSDLDQLAANVHLRRHVVRPADPHRVPPVEAVLEQDDALRERIQCAFEGLTTAGPRNSYIQHARNVCGEVADASAESPSPAVVVVTVLSLEGNGQADVALLDKVRSKLNDDDVRPLGDRLMVQGAGVLPYRIDAVVYMNDDGPENANTLAECRRRLAAWINPRRRLGVEIARSAIDAQLHIPGVARVELIGWQDIRPDLGQAAWCESISVERGG